MYPVLTDMLKARALPALRPREEMLELLFEHAYGYPVVKPEEVYFEELEKPDPGFCAGKAVLHKIAAKCKVNGKDFSFPFYATMPTDGEIHPFFIHINFRDCVPDKYMPTEELVDNGFAVLSLCYTDVTSDDGDFTNGLAGVLYENGERGPSDAGKIAMWAWAMHRVMDYAETRTDVLDLAHAIACGHSRLGKTALYAAATDLRFGYAYSNDSGCSGAALARGSTGETVEVISRVFPFWFCKNYRQYACAEETMPFDQHYLLASIAPRYVMVGSAREDAWACPENELLSCVAASPAFAAGIVCEDRLPETGDCYIEGDIGYHMRAGKHYFSRTDWNQLIRFVRAHM